MRRTLFVIPDSIAGVPIFGFGLLLAALIVSFFVWCLIVYRTPGKRLTEELTRSGYLWVIASIVVVFVLPMIELRTIEGRPLGVAVRGYGMFLLMGVTAGLGLSIARSRSRGFVPDDILGLAIWVFVSAIAGARIFYIIEYRESFMTGDWVTTIRKVMDFTRGGLVVYGSILGGIVAVTLYCRRHKISALKMGDVVIPGLFIGLFFGRIGCLMNGCCYGGRCEEGVWALRFPPGSPVYSAQLETGELIGITWEADEALREDGEEWSREGWPRRVAAATPGSLAFEGGVRPGMVVSRLEPTMPADSELESIAEDDSSRLGLRLVADGVSLFWSADQLPAKALPVRPSQIISSLSGLVICGLLLLVSRFVRLPDGGLTGIGIATYAIARFGEEMVRSDEPGQFGTNLSISQWVSVVIFPIAILGITYIFLNARPKLRDQQ